MPSVLRLSSLSIRYGEQVAVKSLSLEVTAGEVYGLLGPNGSGKSSTLSAVAGLLTPASGEVSVCGRRGDARLIGLVPQELAIYDTLTAAQNVTFFGRLYGLTGRDLARRADEVLDFVRLREHAGQTPATFSGGMQRRLNLACALMHRPPLLLLDEPTVGLDIQSRDAIFANLRDLAAAGTALVFTTHHLAEAELLCHRVGIMHRGEMSAEGTVASLCAGQRWRVDGPHRLERLYLHHTRSGANAA